MTRNTDEDDRIDPNMDLADPEELEKEEGYDEEEAIKTDDPPDSDTPDESAASDFRAASADLQNTLTGNTGRPKNETNGSGSSRLAEPSDVVSRMEKARSESQRLAARKDDKVSGLQLVIDKISEVQKQTKSATDRADQVYAEYESYAVELQRHLTEFKGWREGDMPREIAKEAASKVREQVLDDLHAAVQDGMDKQMKAHGRKLIGVLVLTLLAVVFSFAGLILANGRADKAEAEATALRAQLETVRQQAETASAEARAVHDLLGRPSGSPLRPGARLKSISWTEGGNLNAVWYNPSDVSPPSSQTPATPNSDHKPENDGGAR